MRAIEGARRSALRKVRSQCGQRIAFVQHFSVCLTLNLLFKNTKE